MNQLRSLLWTIKSLIVNQLLRWSLARDLVKEVHVTGIDGNSERARELFKYFNAQISVRNKIVLELGPGKTLETLAYALKAGCKKSIAADVTQYFKPDVARRLGVEYHLFDGKRLPIDAASVDIVWAHYCMQHFRDPRGMLSEVARVLRPGGHLLCRVDLRDHYFMFTPGKEYDCLKYPEWLWLHLASNRSSYVNRLRISEWESIFNELGFVCELLEEHRDVSIYLNNRDHGYLQRYGRRDIETFRFDGCYRYQPTHHSAHAMS